MRWAAAVLVVAVATGARADAGRDRAYLVAAGAAGGGVGTEGLSVPAAGMDLATGYRFTRGVSLEGFFEAWFDFQPYLIPHAGAQCGGDYTQQWHWQAFGARLWGHVAETNRVDFEVAPPWLGIGIVYEHGRSVLAPSDACFRKPYDIAGALVVFGLIAFALEVKLDRHFLLRFATGAEIDLGQGGSSFGVLALTGSIGPAFRF